MSRVTILKYYQITCKLKSKSVRLLHIFYLFFSVYQGFHWLICDYIMSYKNADARFGD